MVLAAAGILGELEGGWGPGPTRGPSYRGIQTLPEQQALGPHGLTRQAWHRLHTPQLHRLNCPEGVTTFTPMETEAQGDWAGQGLWGSPHRV